MKAPVAAGNLRPWWQLNGFTRVRGTDRFWRKVAKTCEPDRCWLWRNGRSGNGYGCIKWHGRVVYAHVLAWTLYHGCPVPRGKVVRHMCDNPLCCRPSHLVLGSHRDNMRDMAERGRTRTHVLTLDQVAELRRLHAIGTPRRELTARYGISQRAFCYIIARRSYANLPEAA